MNSIGSSIVKTCLHCVSNIQLINAAKVVDFPEPVGPVHKTNPLCNLAKFIKASGKPKSFQFGKSFGKSLKVKHLFSFATYALILNLDKPSVR